MEELSVIIDAARTNTALWKPNDSPHAMIDGGMVFYSQVLRALARHSTAARLLFLNVAGIAPTEMSQLCPELAPSERVGYVTWSDLPTVGNMPRPVFFTPTENASVLSGVRFSFGMQNAPLFSFLHAADTNWFLPHYTSYLLRGCQSHDAVVCSSRAGQLVVSRINEELLRRGFASPTPALPIVPLGIFPDEFCTMSRGAARSRLNLHDESCCLLYCGRLEMLGKADLCPLLLLIDSIATATGHDITVICAGSDRPRGAAPRLREFVSSAINNVAVRIADNISHAEKQVYLSGADIFISPSDGIRETFGISLIEAMAAGLPVIATDWSGYREIVEEGENGFLVPTTWHQIPHSAERCASLIYSHDEILSAATSFDFSVMKDAIVALVCNRDLRVRFGMHSLFLACERYSWRKIVADYDRLFIEMLQRGEASRSSSAYPYLEDLFSHYPTRAVDSRRRYVHGVLYSSPLTLAVARTTHNPSWITESILSIIEDHLAETGSVALEDLTREHIDPHIGSLHLGRLCKYGLLDLEHGGDS